MPMVRVKFNVNTEYAYLQNFKILQSTSRSTHAHFMPPVEQEQATFTLHPYKGFDRHVQANLPFRFQTALPSTPSSVPSPSKR